MEAHLCDCTGERHAIDIGADDTPAVVQAIAHQAFRYGAEVVPGELQLSVGGQVLCGEEPLSRAACVEGGCTIDVERVEPLQSYVDKLRGGETSLDQVPLWVQSERSAVLAAVSRSERDLRFASASLLADREFILSVVQESPIAFLFAPEPMRADREVIWIAVRQAPCVLKHAHGPLLADRDFILSLVCATPFAFEYAPEPMRADSGIALAAFQKEPATLLHAHGSLKADRAFVLGAIQKKFVALKYADDSLRADREVVLAALERSGLAYEYADASLQADREIALYALRRTTRSNQFLFGTMPETMRADREVVAAAVQDNPGAMWQAHSSMWYDPKVMRALHPWRSNFLWRLSHPRFWCGCLTCGSDGEQ
eukprot:TRINITY_DN10065_c0_g1_i6.p1 TRINITY_DN10065_c0_g1~~TRINITY_DN10065_c0_g1_i6.p1  ORF type:complete len:387 (+),score=34.81 TRINITY_DN10065_c0_g1_i6:53-1162(+)